MKLHLYILHSSSFDKYYIGTTRDFAKRLIAHNTSLRNTFTSKYRPWVRAALFEAGNSRSKAESLEKFVKTQKSRKLIEKLIDPEFIPTGKLAQLIRVPHMWD